MDPNANAFKKVLEYPYNIKTPPTQLEEDKILPCPMLESVLICYDYLLIFIGTLYSPMHAILTDAEYYWIRPWPCSSQASGLTISSP